MPYTEEQLHDIMDIDGPPTIRQLALQNLRNREQEAQQQSPPMAPTMLGQDEEKDDESVYEEERARRGSQQWGERGKRPTGDGECAIACCCSAGATSSPRDTVGALPPDYDWDSVHCDDRSEVQVKE